MDRNLTIWNFLTKKGLSPCGAAGLMGNLYAESGLNPTNLQDSFEKKLGHTDESYTAAVDGGFYKNFVKDSAGYGLAQWTFWKRKEDLLEFARASRRSIGDLDMQLEFLWQELEDSFHSVLSFLKTAKNVREASDKVLLEFECPKNQSNAVKEKRAAYGQKIYDTYAGGKEENKKMKLFVFAGHGHGDSGAVGYGYTEAERVRVLAKRIKELGGSEVGLGDVNKDYYAQQEINNIPSYVPSGTQVLELHMDSNPSSSPKGGHVIIKCDADSYDNQLADMISTMFPGRAKKLVERNDLYNLNQCAAMGYPYRLMECGFISNSGDLNIFNTNIDTLARKILQIFGITATSTGQAGGWEKDKTGWWYKNADGSYPKSQWMELDAWYYFNEKGYAVTGWQEIDGNWYFFDGNCRMLKETYVQSQSAPDFYHWVDSSGKWDEKSDSWNVNNYSTYKN